MAQQGRGEKSVKISKGEGAIILLTVAFLAFTAGWFLRAANLAQPLRVETQRELETAPIALPAPTETPERGKVDLNTAGLEELRALPGIGEKRAADIIAEREANGPFRYPEDLTRVSGIGEGTVEALLDYVTVGGETS